MTDYQKSVVLESLETSIRRYKMKALATFKEGIEFLQDQINQVNDYDVDTRFSAMARLENYTELLESVFEIDIPVEQTHDYKYVIRYDLMHPNVRKKIV